MSFRFLGDRLYCEDQPSAALSPYLGRIAACLLANGNAATVAQLLAVGIRSPASLRVHLHRLRAALPDNAALRCTYGRRYELRVIKGPNQ